MKNIKEIAEILRYSGFKARADFENGVIKVKTSQENVQKINKIYNVDYVVMAK